MLVMRGSQCCHLVGASFTGAVVVVDLIDVVGSTCNSVVEVVVRVVSQCHGSATVVVDVVNEVVCSVVSCVANKSDCKCCSQCESQVLLFNVGVSAVFSI